MIAALAYAFLVLRRPSSARMSASSSLIFFNSSVTKLLRSSCCDIISFIMNFFFTGSDTYEKQPFKNSSKAFVHNIDTLGSSSSILSVSGALISSCDRKFTILSLYIMIENHSKPFDEYVCFALSFDRYGYTRSNSS